MSVLQYSLLILHFLDEGWIVQLPAIVGLESESFNLISGKNNIIEFQEKISLKVLVDTNMTDP